MGNFLAVAPKLAKNPLGIIALFIVLVYGFAALVVGTDGGNLMPEHKIPKRNGYDRYSYDYF